MQLFRDGKIKMDEMQALASVSDHARQEAAWKAAKQGYCHRPTRIRELLAETEMRGDTAIARYVTVAAYEKAGGAVRRDLFENDVYLDDPEKVRTMALAKMQRSKFAKTVAAEGWGWVECRESFSYADRKLFGEVQRVRREPTRNEAKQIAALQDKADKIAEQISAMEEAGDDYDEEQYAALREQHEALESQIEALQDALCDYPPDYKPLAGVVLHLDHSGDLTATRGLIRQDDREAVAGLQRTGSPDSDLDAAVDLPPAKTRPVHSEALIQRLQAQRVMALQAEIIQRPNLALCLLIEQLLGEVGDPMERAYLIRSFELSATRAHHDLTRADPTLEQSSAWEVVQKEAESRLRDVPKAGDAVLPWLLAQPQDANIALLAALISVTVYRVRYNGSPSVAHLNRLGDLVGLDMSQWWTPTVQSYLGHVSKDRIAAVVAEILGEVQAKSLAAMKKAQAAEAAEKLLAGHGWVPDVMRASASDAQADDSPDGDDLDSEDQDDPDEADDEA